MFFYSLQTKNTLSIFNDWKKMNIKVVISCGEWLMMAEWKGMCSSPARTLKLQLIDKHRQEDARTHQKDTSRPKDKEAAVR